MRTLFTIMLLLWGLAITGCPKSASKASGPTLTVNGQALAPVAWDTLGQSIKIHNPFDGTDEAQTAEAAFLSDIANLPAYVWNKGTTLEISVDPSWDSAKHGLYLLVPATPEEIATGERMLSQASDSSTGSAQLPAPRNVVRHGELRVLTKFGPPFPPKSTTGGVVSYDWQAIDDEIGGGGSLGLCAIVTPYDKSCYLVYQYAPVDTADQEAAQQAIRDALKQQEQQSGN